MHMLASIGADTSISIGQIAYICSVIVAIATAVTVIVKTVNNTVNKITKITIDKALKDNKEEIHNDIMMNHDALSSSLEDINSKLTDYILSNNNNNDIIRSNLLATTRDRINQAHDYYVAKKYIGVHSLSVLEDLYSSYKALGGNSFVEREMKDLRELEVYSVDMVKKIEEEEYRHDK